MFASRFTLHRKEFSKVKRGARLVQDTNFAVLVKTREPIGNPRFGIVISNKVSKLSTHRNRIRRGYRDVLRRNWKKVEDKYDLVFLIKPGIEKQPVADMMKDVEKFLDEKKYIERASKS